MAIGGTETLGATEGASVVGVAAGAELSCGTLAFRRSVPEGPTDTVGAATVVGGADKDSISKEVGTMVGISEVSGGAEDVIGGAGIDDSTADVGIAEEMGGGTGDSKSVVVGANEGGAEVASGASVS